ncbi:MAG: hypothetical protein ACLTOX_03775 [Streptococcus thermophilus]
MPYNTWFFRVLGSTGLAGTSTTFGVGGVGAVGPVGGVGATGFSLELQPLLVLVALGPLDLLNGVGSCGLPELQLPLGWWRWGNWLFGGVGGVGSCGLIQLF